VFLTPGGCLHLSLLHKKSVCRRCLHSLSCMMWNHTSYNSFHFPSCTCQLWSYFSVEKSFSFKLLVQSVDLELLWCFTQWNAKVPCAACTSSPFESGCTKKLVISNEMLTHPIFFVCFVVSKCATMTNVSFWTKSFRGVLILYIHFINLYFSQHNYIKKA